MDPVKATSSKYAVMTPGVEHWQLAKKLKNADPVPGGAVNVPVTWVHAP